MSGTSLLILGSMVYSIGLIIVYFTKPHKLINSSNKPIKLVTINIENILFSVVLIWGFVK